MSCVVRDAAVISLATKSRLFETDMALAAVLLRVPGCPSSRHAAVGRRSASAAYGLAPYAPCNGALDRTFSGRTRPGRRAPGCGWCVSRNSHWRVGLQWGARGREAALPACVRGSVPGRPVAVMSDAAHAAVSARSASRYVSEAERCTGSVIHLTVASRRVSARAIGSPSDGAPDTRFPVFTCCGAGRPADNIHVHADMLAYRCVDTGHYRR